MLVLGAGTVNAVGDGLMAYHAAQGTTPALGPDVMRLRERMAGARKVRVVPCTSSLCGGAPLPLVCNLSSLAQVTHVARRWSRLVTLSGLALHLPTEPQEPIPGNKLPCRNAWREQRQNVTV